MGSELDFLLAPVMQGLISYESLKNGTLNYYDVALLNHALMVQCQNTYLLSKEKPNG